MKDKGKKIIEKKNKVLERLQITYVSPEAIKPNSYNPNVQTEHDFNLLLKSMSEDGFTTAIVCQKDGTIVDGEHRWRAAKQLGFTEIPVVFVDMTPEQMRIATLRHNRARGSEDIELSVQVLRDLEKLGALDWAQDSLMLSDNELQKLMSDIPAPEALANEEFSQAWTPSEGGDEMAALARARDPTQGAMVGGNLTGLTMQAAERLREAEARIKAAKSDEERAAIRKEMQVYRISVVYSNDEAIIVKQVLGTQPAVKILDLCKEKATAP